MNSLAPLTIIVVNDSAGAIIVYPAVGEKTNGSANAGVSIASGASGLFLPVLNSPQNYPSPLDWRTTTLA